MIGARRMDMSAAPARWLNGLRGGRSAPDTNAGGILMVGSDAFRKVCAIHEHGTYYFVRDYNTAELAAELQALGQQFALPPETTRKGVTLGEIASLYSAGDDRTDSTGLEAGARRMLGILNEAAANRASDVKIFIRDAHADLRIKLGHVEVTHDTQWKVNEAREAISWLFNARDYGDGASSEEQGAFQAFSVSKDGKIPLPEGVGALRCQKGAQGLQGHDFLVARLIFSDGDRNEGDIAGLGFDAEILDVLAEERASPGGMMIIGGSTGDGKSTTLVRQLERLNIERGGRISLYTVEDPIEYPMKGTGIMQMAVPGGKTAEDQTRAYTSVLMSFVRTNPDVGMVSEIRSAENAKLILQFVTSGHKIFTTVHAASANNVLFRLISLGVDPRELAEPGVVSLVMRQKLVPVLCANCAITPDEVARARIADWCNRPDAAPKLRNREGCATCLSGRTDVAARAAWAGFSSKRAVAEYIRVDNTYREYVATRDSIGAWTYWLTPKEDGGLGGRTVEDQMRTLVATGVADYGESALRPLDPAEANP